MTPHSPAARCLPQAGAYHGRHPVEEDNRRAQLEGKVDHVIGVDTHRDAHAAAILDRSGGLLAQLEVPSSQAGYEELLGLVAQQAPGRRCWALEGTGYYGAGLASFLADHSEWVTEIDRPKRTGRTQAKSDPLDAIRAAREALSREHLATPRQRGQREALRVLQVTRAGAVKVSADARRHLKALLVTAPEPLRQALRGGTWLRQARACAALTAQPGDPVEYRATVRALRTTSKRALAAHQEATQLARSWARWPGRWRRRCWPSRASARSLARKC